MEDKFENATAKNWLQQRIDEVEGEAASEMLELKLLGVSWDISNDNFQFYFRDVLNFIKSFPPTKQSILQASAKIFDPLGLFSPFVVLLSKVVQEQGELGCDMMKHWNKLI